MAERQLGLMSLNADELGESISRLGDEDFREELKERLMHASFLPGARQAADMITQIAAES